MAFKKIHRRADIAPAVHKRQLLGTSTSSHAATSASSSGYQGDLPPGPPLYVSTGTSASTSRTTSGTSTSGATQSTSISTTASSSSQQQVAATSSPRATSAAAGSTASRSTVTRVVSTTSRASATVTSASTESDGMGVGTMAGIAAAAIVAIGIASIFVVWLMRRKRKNSDIDEVPFNRDSYHQHATAIPDDDSHLPSRMRPTPGLDMSERQPTPMYGGAPTFSDMSHNSFGYHTQPSYQPGQMYGASPFGPGGAPATPLPHSPGYGTQYDQQGYNAGGYAELTRGGPHDYPPSPRVDQYPPSPSYGHENFPAPPAERDVVNHKQVNYPELSPAPIAQQGHVVTANSSVHDGRETPVQLGFAPAQPRQPAPAAGQGHGKSARPETVYDNEDAYGGM
ncbi:hypothetical protein FRC15_005693 [Serendipita sp. 397]|nr:hypothetical protein FRC15_005693 [Serendipita sp. 397]KAG8798568.1 hypothetical protein FRC16_006998 [Serendipita sp. 398]